MLPHYSTLSNKKCDVLNMTVWNKARPGYVEILLPGSRQNDHAVENVTGTIIQ